MDKLLKADINFSASGDNTIIAAPAGGRIAIDFVGFRAEGTTTLQMKDGTTAYGGPFAMLTKEGMTFDNVMRNHDGIMTLGLGNAFIINSTLAVQVSGFVRYRIIDQN